MARVRVMASVSHMASVRVMASVSHMARYDWYWPGMIGTGHVIGYWPC